MPVHIDIDQLYDPFDGLNTKERAGYFAAMADKYSRLQRLENDKYAARTQDEKAAIEQEILALHGVTISADSYKVSAPIESDEGNAITGGPVNGGLCEKDEREQFVPARAVVEALNEGHEEIQATKRSAESLGITPAE